MTRDEDNNGIFNQEDHQVAYIFDPDQDNKTQRPSKRRRVSRKSAANKNDDDSDQSELFVPLLNGLEAMACAELRHQLFEASWAGIDERIQKILRDSNSATLDQVVAFTHESRDAHIEKIPCAFIITGTNIASQDLLFDQLSETLQATNPSKFVRLRSSEANTLKTVLKKVIQSATSTISSEDNEELGVQDGRRYLDYDLEALNKFLKTQDCERVYVAFQDSEAFDSSLLSDLIGLFRSWRPRIQFVLLFGIATSVELLQARLLKSACRQIYGGQFDCVQTDTILETVFKGAVASSDIPLRLGPVLLKWMLDRQRDQVAGIQSFISTLKYAYMTHFYANPLSILLSAKGRQDSILQPEHLEALRNTLTFRNHVESSIASEAPDALFHARALLEDDKYLVARIQASVAEWKSWIDERLRSLLMLEAAGAHTGKFPKAYVDAMNHGILMNETSHFVDCVRRMGADKLQLMLERIISLLHTGDKSLNLGPVSIESGNDDLQTGLEEQLQLLKELRAKAAAGGLTLRSKYSGHGKVMRTTIIAQRVQLSRDSAALGEEDRQLTSIVDEVTTLFSQHRHDESRPGRDVLFSESWLYDSRNLARDVFVPRPRTIFERSLARPHDYLGCKCCAPTEDGAGAGEGAAGPVTLPATAILYQLYLETGSIINVADLWSAFYARVDSSKHKQPSDDTEEEEQLLPEGDNEDDSNERKALVMFYRGLAELRSLGYIKASKKKVDHIAKVKWL